jgi:hypothetical protein
VGDKKTKAKGSSAQRVEDANGNDHTTPGVCA